MEQTATDEGHTSSWARPLVLNANAHRWHRPFHGYSSYLWGSKVSCIATIELVLPTPLHILYRRYESV